MRRYPTAQEIEEMQARGFDASVVAQQRELAERGKILEGLIAATVEAFSGVKLGSGVGLFEAEGLDDYASESVLAAHRAKDEKLNWQAIPVEALNRCNSSLSFFDAQGMRFHLPAFLTASMRGEYRFDLVYSLTQSTVLDDQCSLLDSAQRRVVRQYLQFVEAEEDHAFDREHIRRALESYWAE